MNMENERQYLLIYTINGFGFSKYKLFMFPKYFRCIAAIYSMIFVLCWYRKLTGNLIWIYMSIYSQQPGYIMECKM